MPAVIATSTTTQVDAANPVTYSPVQTGAAGSRAAGASQGGYVGAFQAGLDVLSLALDASVVGAPFSFVPDLLNAGISLAQGDTTGAGLSAFAAIHGIGASANAIRLGRAARAGVQATRSTLQIGQRMHRAYKSDLVDGVTRLKEFRFATGRRADFIDLEQGIIYELKPDNARGIREGTRQLEQYLRDAQAQFPGINWRTVLDTY